MKIAMLGTRGIPAAYSGFETAVEHLAREFALRGHEVTVYCRPHMVERRETHVGARLVHIPTVQNKYLDTLVHTARCTAHMVRGHRPDVALYFISGNAPVVPFARLAGVPTVFQIDGLDSERAKWPAAARAYIRVGVKDQPGVLAAIATALGTEGVSISSVLQYDPEFTGGDEGTAELVLTTHSAPGRAFNAALDVIRELDVVLEIGNVLPMEG